MNNNQIALEVSNGFNEAMLKEIADKVRSRTAQFNREHHDNLAFPPEGVMVSLVAESFANAIEHARRGAALLIILQRHMGEDSLNIACLDAHFKAFHEPLTAAIVSLLNLPVDTDPELAPIKQVLGKDCLKRDPAILPPVTFGKDGTVTIN